MARVGMVVSNPCNPDPRVMRGARWLVDAGHHVTIHAFDREGESDIVIEDGVTIQRHSPRPTPYGGTLRTALGLRSFHRTARREMANAGYDVVLCHDVDTAPIARWLKERTSIRVVLDVHDLWHTWIRMPSPRSAVRRFISARLEGWSIRQMRGFDGVLTSSDGFQKWLDERGVQAIVIENRTEPHPLPLPDSLAIGRFGVLREPQAIELLAHAIRGIEPRPTLHLAGRAVLPDDVVKFAPGSEYHGPYSDDDVPGLMSRINVMFAMYPPERGNISDGALPSKMFEAAAHGRPSIVNSGTHMAEVCERLGIGVSAKWGDVDDVRRAIMDAMSMGIVTPPDPEENRIRFLSGMFGD